MGEGDCLLDVDSTTELAEKKTTVKDLLQIIRIVSNACDSNNIRRIEQNVKNKTVLQKIIRLKTTMKETLSQPSGLTQFRNSAIDLLLTGIYEDCQGDDIALLFSASAKFDISKLRDVIAQLSPEDINQTKYSDSAIIFALKYGNISNENFLNCMKTLIEAGVDVNKFDFIGKTAIDLIARLYEKNKNREEVLEILKQVAQNIVDQGICKPDDEKTLKFLTHIKIRDDDKFGKTDDKTRLFYWISKNKPHEFLSYTNIKPFVDDDDGENTLLQLATKKGDNMVSVVQHLLKNGADPNKTTNLNIFTPLELAANNGKQLIFKELLNNNKTMITQEQYNDFVRNRFHSKKSKMFELVLESKRLDPTLKYAKNGNTPLHFAIYSDYKKAIHMLLKRNSSLIVENKFKKTALDIIDAEDLEKYFDSCLALDNHNPCFTAVNYKMELRFDCLVDDQTATETKVVSNIGKHPNIEHLLTHPFIHTFIKLKWLRMKTYFWSMLCFQALDFVLLSIFLYYLPYATGFAYFFGVLLTIVNFFVKVPILLFSLDRVALHGSFEIIIILTIFASFLQKEYRAFVFVEMAFSFLLTAGYHPRLSKWSLMLQQVFKTFTALLIFFSLIVVAFSVGFNILFPHDAFFKHFFSAIFKTSIMTTGEFNIEDDTGLDKSGFVGYLIFIIFAMSVSLVIVNFWTGVAVTDIERIEKNSEINAFKNVIICMLFIDYTYTKFYSPKLRNYFPNPLLFLRIDNNGSIRRPKKCAIDFFVNRQKQIEKVDSLFEVDEEEVDPPSKTDDEKTDLPSKLDDESFNKIRSPYHKLTRVSNEKEILSKFDQLSKMVNKTITNEKETSTKLDEILKMMTKNKNKDEN